MGSPLPSPVPSPMPTPLPMLNATTNSTRIEYHTPTHYGLAAAMGLISLSLVIVIITCAVGSHYKRQKRRMSDLDLKSARLEPMQLL